MRKRKGEFPRGARGRRTGAGVKLRGWLHHHRSSARDAGRKILDAPVQSGMTALVIAIALGLPAALYVAVNNLQRVSTGIENTAQITVYLQQGIKPATVDELQNKLRAHKDINTITFISSEDALKEFQRLSGLGEALDSLEENPLPAVLMLQSVHPATDPVAAKALVDELRSWTGVDDVGIDMKWVQRLHAILAVGRRIALALGVALSLGVLVVIGNTIRLAVQNRRDEIVVVKLVGGTDGYVRRPFLYTGLWYGLLGGFGSWLLVWGGMLWLSSAVSNLSDLYQSGFRLSGLGVRELGALLLCGSVLGFAGAWLAVGKHLNDVEPA